MPFNKELEDFAAALSSGYAMAKSPQEKENERLRNEALQQGMDLAASAEARDAETYKYGVSQRPILAERERLKFETDLETARLGQEESRAKLEVAAHERKRRSELEEQQRLLFEVQFAKDKADATKAAWEADPTNLEKRQAAIDAEAEVNRQAARQTELENVRLGHDVAIESNIFDRMQGALGGTAPQEQAVPVDSAPPAPVSQAVPTGLSISGPITPDVQTSVANIQSGKGTKKDVLITGREAMKEGLKQLADTSGVTQESAVNSPEAEEAQRQFLTGANGADPDTAQMVLDSVNEVAGGDMPYHEQLLSALATGWTYYNAIGQPDKAKNYAAGMIGHYQQMAGQYAAVARAAMEAGDMDAATEAAARAYIHARPGDNVTFKKAEDGKHIVVTTTNAKGRRSKQLLTPEELGGLATQMSPDRFVPTMLSAAGAKDDTISDAAAIAIGREYNLDPAEITNLTTSELQPLLDKAKGPKIDLEEMTAIEGAVETVVGELQQADPKTLTPEHADVLSKALGDEYRDDLETAAVDIKMQNPQLRPDVAVKAAARLMLERAEVDMGKSGDNSEYVNIKMPGIPKFKINKQYYQNQLNIRNKLVGDAAASAAGDVSNQEQSRKERKELSDSARKFFDGLTAEPPPDADVPRRPFTAVNPEDYPDELMRRENPGPPGWMQQVFGM